MSEVRIDPAPGAKPEPRIRTDVPMPAALGAPKLEPGPESAPPRRWFATRWGSWLMGIAGFLLYGGLAQLLPSIAIAVILLVSMGGQPSPEEIERGIIPYIPLLAGWAAAFSLALVGILKLVGWLAPGPRPVRPIPAIAWVIGSAIVCFAGQMAISIGQTHLGIPVKEQAIILEGLKIGGIGFYAAGIVIAPLGEEFFFRRFLHSTLRAANGPYWACAGSAFLFMIIHFNPTGALVYVWMAACFTVAYEKSGSIWGAIAAHVINNGVAFAAGS